jgi:hypothetical protein
LKLCHLKIKVGSSPFYEFCPKKTVGALLYVRFERGLTVVHMD